MATGSRMYYGSYQFVPAPLFSWSTDTIYDQRNERLCLHHVWDFAGVILSPAAESGRLDYLITKREELQDALTVAGQEFKLYFNDILQVSGVYPRLTGLSFDRGVWVDRLNYAFTLEWDEDFYSQAIQSWTENWQFEEAEDRRTANVQHDVSAVGLNTNPSGVNNAFTNAQTFVLAKTGYANAIAGTPGFIQVSGSYSAYESVSRTEQCDVQGGSYSVSEAFVLSSGLYIHTDSHQYGVDENGVVTITLNGTIKGFGRGDLAYDRALAVWPTIRNAFPATASGVYRTLGGDSTLYTNNYQSLSVTKNRFTGTIEYTVSYSDSETENLPSGVLEFALSVQDNKPTRVYASFPIPERALGNVIQDISTSNEGTYTLSGNATGKQSYAFSDLLNYTETRINAKRPLSINYETLRLTQKQITKDEENNSIQFNIVWTYTVALSQVASATDEIILD